MKNVLKSLRDKLKSVNDRVKSGVNKLPGIGRLKAARNKLRAPEVQAKLMQRSGAGLLGGAAVAFGVIIFAPALAVPAGATCLALMGTGFGLLQESDNKKHGIWMKEHAANETPAPVVPAPVTAPVAQPEPAAPAPVFELKLPGAEFAKAAEPKEAAIVAAPAVAPEAPKPAPATPKP